MVLSNISYHQLGVSRLLGQNNINWNIATDITATTTKELHFQFRLHQHPYIEELMQELVQKSVKGLQDADTLKEGDRWKFSKAFFNEEYIPTDLVEEPYPIKDIDFTSNGSYSVYNWELFYHIPLTVALHLTKNQRFAEAQQWLHYIFDPTDDTEDESTSRFWKVKPFTKQSDIHLIEEVLRNLADENPQNEQLQKDTINNIEAWKDNPFKPFATARYRPSAFMLKTVMTYLDNLIAWGDSLFQQDTGESINEATQIYILAANLLGPRPQEIPKRGTIRPQTYASIRENLDEFSNVLVELEQNISFNLTPLPSDMQNDVKAVLIQNIGSSLYFCIPRNEKLMGYWDTVTDRMFKIHNSLNLQGVFRQLPLFEPPIDPALLARASAVGLNMSSILSGLNQPLPLVRFRLMVQKALELCQEVKGLGGQLLSNIEKEDNEAMAMLRSQHEIGLLKFMEATRYAQWKEAEKNLEGLEVSLENAKQRYIYYERLMGKKEDEIEIPELESVASKAIETQKFRFEEPIIDKNYIDVLPVSDSRYMLNSYEKTEIDLNEAAQIVNEVAGGIELVGAIMNLIPQIEAAAKPMGAGVGVTIGGINIGNMLSGIASAIRVGASRVSYQANQTSKMGGYYRRQLDWSFQSNSTAGEINQIYKQLVAAEIRVFVAKKEYENHQQQIKNAEEINHFIQGEKNETVNHKKVSTQGFYSWMKRNVRDLYNQYYKFAFEVSQKAEKAIQHELGDFSTSYLKFDYTQGKEGLLSGEKLHLDLKRMEMAYYDLNKREYELTKHISIKQLNPLALLSLKVSSSCEISLPETYFDIDCPGHYFRRIKSVAISIPCVVGPYTSINCKLVLLKSSVRKQSNLLDSEYKRNEEGEDTRFSDNYSATDAIVTSSAQNDSGIFEPNLNDERYLPFEYSGAVSTWRLELPATVKQFDYNTISDVILHMRYTAREGGELLKGAAEGNITTILAELENNTLSRMFSLKHDFPNEWHRYFSITDDSSSQNKKFEISIKREHLNYISQSGTIDNIKIQVFSIIDGQKPEPIYELTPASPFDKNPNENEEKNQLKINLDLNGLEIGKGDFAFLMFNYSLNS